MLDISSNEYLKQINKNEYVVLAVSGGVDSTVLLDLMMKLNYKIVIAHVNHHKRKESVLEEKYIKEFGEKNNIPVEVLDYYYKEDNFQAEAHDERYKFFLDVAHKYKAKYVLTAHHAYDNLETILMNIIRGSNLYGYAGISEALDYEDITILRPLLSYAKEDIYKYAESNNITYFEDSSNQTNDYMRNRLRHNVIPVLAKENPNLATSITNYSKQAFGAFHVLREQTIKFLQEKKEFDSAAFNKLPKALKKDILNYLFEEYNIASSDNKITDVIELIKNNKPNLSYDLGNNYQFIKSYESCYISTPKNSIKVREELYKYDTVVLDDYGSFYFRHKVVLDKTFDYLPISENEKYPLILRNREDGDKLIIGDGHKKLKDFLIDKKVPLEERDKILVVANADGEIIWVIGYYKKKIDEENPINLIYERNFNNDK